MVFKSKATEDKKIRNSKKKKKKQINVPIMLFPLEKEMATHSSILAWRIPWTEEPGRLQSTGSQRVGQKA